MMQIFGVFILPVLRFWHQDDQRRAKIVCIRSVMMLFDNDHVKNMMSIFLGNISI